MLEKATWNRPAVEALMAGSPNLASTALPELHKIHLRALSCFNNMLLLLPIPVGIYASPSLLLCRTNHFSWGGETDKSQAQALWEVLCKQCVQAAQPLPSPIGIFSDPFCV